MSAVTAPESERQPWCSICYHPLGTDDPCQILDHVIDEHSDHVEVVDFVESVEIGRHCNKCVTWFYSDVELHTVTNRNGSTSSVIKARPLCEDCRESNRAFKKLVTERLTLREIVDRGRLKSQE